MIPITKPCDLLEAKPIATQLAKAGEKPVMDLVMKSITKCANGLGIDMSADVVETLAEDLIEVYRYDSIEDIIQTLKKGRQGIYGFGHERRNSLNMQLISDWMSKHLEDKARAREERMKSKYSESSKPIIEGDIYENYTPPKTGPKKLEGFEGDAKYEAYKAELYSKWNKENEKKH